MACPFEEISKTFSDNIMILIVGGGYMAGEYAKVLSASAAQFEVVTRGDVKVSTLRKDYPAARIVTGGIENYACNNRIPAQAIVAVNEDNLFTATRSLLENGAKS